MTVRYLSLLLAPLLWACDSEESNHRTTQENPVHSTQGEDDLNLQQVEFVSSMYENMYVNPYDYCDTQFLLECLHFNWNMDHPFAPKGDIGYEWMEFEDQRRFTHHGDSNWVRVELYRGDGIDEPTVFDFRVRNAENGFLISDMRPKFTRHSIRLDSLDLNHENHIVIWGDVFSFVHLNQDEEGSFVISQVDEETYPYLTAPFRFASIKTLNGFIPGDSIETFVDSLSNTSEFTLWKVENMSSKDWRIEQISALNSNYE